jgi:putative transposase
VPSDDELALRAFLRDFARRRPRWGWRRAARATNDACWRVNHKRIHRLWIAEGLRVPDRKRRKPLRGIGQAVGAMCPIRPNVVWAMGFQFDQTSGGRTIKLLSVIDEYTREALATDVERSIDADEVVTCLERLAAERGAPAYVRFDHGPEFIAYGVADWCRLNGTNTVFIDPSSPAERLDRELQRTAPRRALDGQQFDNLLEAKVFIEDWRIDHNMNRPQSAHGCLTPVEFVEAWLHRQAHRLA